MITRHDVISISGYLKMKIAMEKRGRCQHFNFLQHMLKRMHMHMHHTNVFKKGFEAIAIENICGKKHVFWKAR